MPEEKKENLQGLDDLLFLLETGDLNQEDFVALFDKEVRAVVEKQNSVEILRQIRDGIQNAREAEKLDLSAMKETLTEVKKHTELLKSIPEAVAKNKPQGIDLSSVNSRLEELIQLSDQSKLLEQIALAVKQNKPEKAELNVDFSALLKAVEELKEETKKANSPSAYKGGAMGPSKINLKDLSGKAINPATDPMEVSAGNTPGHSIIHKFGQAPDFDTGDGVVDIWDGANDGGIDAMQYTYSTTADIDRVSSDSASDTFDLEVQGLDANYDLVVQTVTLTGLTPVALTTDLIRVFRMKNVGSADNVGNIYCFVDTADTTPADGVPDDKTKIRSVMSAGNNQTLMAIYTIPNGCTGFMYSFFTATAGASKTADYQVDLFARKQGGVFQLKHREALQDGGTTHEHHTYHIPEKFTEKTDIVIRAKILSSNITAASISGGFEIELVNN